MKAVNSCACLSLHVINSQQKNSQIFDVGTAEQAWRHPLNIVLDQVAENMRKLIAGTSKCTCTNTLKHFEHLSHLQVCECGRPSVIGVVVNKETNVVERESSAKYNET